MVSSFVAELQVASVVFNWEPPAPEDRNGILIAYELAYRVNSSMDLTRENFTDVSVNTFMIRLAPYTNVSDISLRAYTSVGPGDAATTEDIFIPAALIIRE